MKYSLVGKAARQAAVACVAAMAFAGLAAAQPGSGSNWSGPGGGGSGVSGMLGVGAKPPGGIGGGAGGSVGNAVSGQAGRFSNPPAGGIQVTNPATGTTVTVPLSVSQGLGQLLSGNAAGGPAFLAGLTAGGSLAAGPANALVNALAALGSDPSFEDLQAAVIAYNNAVNALTGAVPPALLAVRSALAAML